MSNAGIPFELKFSRLDVIDIKSFVDDMLDEGIDLHPAYDEEGNMKFDVSYNPRHSKGIDTSLERNPTSFDLEVPKIKLLDGKLQVFSVFKRTKMKSPFGSPDGNPLVYAFKDENNYRFKTEYDKLVIQQLISQILDKFVKSYFAALSGNVATIVCPSENELNSKFAEALAKAASANDKKMNLFDSVLTKLSVDTVVHDVFDNANSPMNRWLVSIGKRAAREMRRQLDEYFDRMRKEHNNVFSYHFIKNPDLRNIITKTMSIEEHTHAGIDGKHVLVVDDTVSRGKTLAEAYELICTSYNPASITALTLFSPLK